MRIGVHQGLEVHLPLFEVLDFIEKHPQGFASGVLLEVDEELDQAFQVAA